MQPQNFSLVIYFRSGNLKTCLHFLQTEMYIENMLRLESGAIREFVGSRMLMAVIDLLIELDVS